MGVQATMIIGDKKASAAATVASGAATFPITNQVSVVSILPAADSHRLADIERAVEICIDYMRDNNLYGGASPLYVVTTLDGGRNTVRTNNVATEVVTNDVGIMINNFERAKGSRNIIDNAHKQLLDWMRENERLVA